MMEIKFSFGVYSESFGDWSIVATQNPLGCPSVSATDLFSNRVVLDSDGDFVIDALCVPLALIERMIAVWRALGGE